MTELTAQQAPSPRRRPPAADRQPGLDGPESAEARARRRFRFDRITIRLALVVMILLVGLAVSYEAKTSSLQSLFVSRAVKDMTFSVEPGPSAAIRFPEAGPYDRRLGYAQLPSFIDRLATRHFAVELQARQSPLLRRFIDAGGYAVYHEKAQAGLELRDRAGLPLEEARYPSTAYPSFAAVPPLVAHTLRFIEDRDLLDPERPNRNPAVEWQRFGMAALGRAGRYIDPSLSSGGGSTLATQIEKFRHSPGGRTEGLVDKLRQMSTATARAYLDGPETLAAQQEILTTYINSTPLGSRPGYGEVIGLGDGLLAWYGTDFTEANRALAARPPASITLERRGEIYKQALSLLIAQRRPSYYLNGGRGALQALTNSYLRRLSAAGVIGPVLRDAALKADLRFRSTPPAPATSSFVERKAIDAVRTELMTALGATNLYSLDRIDLAADATVDAATQERVASVLLRLKDREAVKALGLVGDKLLGAADPAQVAYSVVLYERGADRNYVRVHADSLDQPFDINSGAKLILGSTAKLRTLVTYLGIITDFNREMAGLPSAKLHAQAAATQDPLRRWAAEYLAGAGDRSLQPMLDAAMQRRYSGSPSEIFFTGGGAHVFHNFERSEDYQSPTVEDALARSINLAFVRLMRDLVRHYENEGGDRDGLLSDVDNPARAEYLRRFADKEGRAYLGRFYEEYRGLTADEAMARLAGHIRPIPRRLAVAFRSVRPEASEAELGEFLAARLPGRTLDEDDIAELHEKYAPKLFSLNDRGYLAGINPLELWLVAYLQANPGASRGQVMAAGEQARQSAYSWLFKTRNAHKQDVRIRELLEEDAFDRLLQDWRRQGYPFERLVPSLATAIGSSGDRPEALGKLMGIIVNGGVKLPTTDLERVHFAAGTPYETQMVYRPEAPERVMAPEVAATVRRALAGVVASGTATRLRGAYTTADGAPLPVGGKTGTGDNRFDTFGPGHALIESRVVDRTATFVFFLGDRFYGTVTAYVSGDEAENYKFTSALAVSLLKALAPQVKPLIDAPAPDHYTRAPQESADARHVHNAVASGAEAGDGRDAPGTVPATN
ncbi:MAG TPA: transglycosylase domain-containing protein [Stellaceae bacterium]|nr:transglycosylase domain-containing protein [Stellaceae bacterium]